MQYFRFYFPIICLLFIISCGGGAEGDIQYFDKEKTKKWWERIPQPDGTSLLTYYYPSGKKRKEERYLDNKLHGKFMKWYDNENIEVDKTFKNGLKDGKHIRYYSNGTVSAEQSYNEGALEGKWKYFYENGNLWLEERYESGEMVEHKRHRVNKQDA